MRTQIVFGLIALIALGGILPGVLAQGQPDHVVINEIEINPPGDDTKSISEWVELYNPTDEEVDIGKWKIASMTGQRKTLTIPEFTTIKPQQHITFQYTTNWFTDVSETVQLKDREGIVVDEIYRITDLDDSFDTWQRTFDGIDTDTDADWEFSTANAGSSNGVAETQQTFSSGPIITLTTDKDVYLLGEDAQIIGSVSEQLFVTKPTYQAERVIIEIDGPGGYFSSREMHVDYNLEFLTTLQIKSVFGLSEGIYDVTAFYGGNSVTTQFIVGTVISESIDTAEPWLTISTDKEVYIPGENPTIFANTNKLIPLEGLKFSVKDQGGIVVASGVIYPVENDFYKAVRGGTVTTNTDALFTTTFFLDNINPSYGTYSIEGEYGNLKFTDNFEVLEDIKEDVRISLFTDKDFYLPGETVLIEGRLNNLWVPNLNLEILQTKVTNLNKVGLNEGTNVYKHQSGVTLEGDSRFTYEYKIPANDNALGDWTVRTWKDVGTAQVTFSVVSDTENLQIDTRDFFVETDRNLYSIGDNILISGYINEQIHSSQFYTHQVDLFLSKEGGEGIRKIDNLKPQRKSDPLREVPVFSSASPDAAGRWQVRDTISRTAYEPGIWNVRATYADGKFFSNTQFEIVDPLDIGDDKFRLSLDKQVYGLNEYVYLSGIVALDLPISFVDITITEPGGKTRVGGALVEENRFEWKWLTPLSEKTQQIKDADDRSQSALSNFGIYKMNVRAQGGSQDLFFKVSEFPELEQDTPLVVAPLTITTDKTIIKPGQNEQLAVSGQVLPREQGKEGLQVPERVQIQIKTTTFPEKVIRESFVYPDQGGNYRSVFMLPANIFLEGNYKVTGKYLNHRAETNFDVQSNVVFGGEPGRAKILLALDKETYAPGDKVIVSGKLSKLVFVDVYRISFVQRYDNAISCEQYSFQCGVHKFPPIEVRPEQDGTFEYEFTIPDNENMLGTYDIIVDVGFEIESKKLDVVPKSEASPTHELVGKQTEKFNRIPDSSIQMFTVEKITESGDTLAPRILQGSLLIPGRGHEASVNLKVTSESGLCIIGQEFECLISDSTRAPGQIYEMVLIDDVSYKVRYSGPDVRLEKFTILPEDSDAVIPDSFWNVDITKDSQATRFYYKVTYIPIATAPSSLADVVGEQLQ